MPTYEDMLKKLRKRRDLREALARCDVRVRAAGRSCQAMAKPFFISDTLLRLMAHRLVERSCQQTDMHGTVVRICKHHGWNVEEAPAHPLEDETVSSLEKFVMDEDDAFSSLLSEEDKYVWAIQYIQENGEDAFFYDCYGLAGKDKEGAVLSGREQRLVKTYWLLRHLQKLPVAEGGVNGGGGEIEGRGGEGGAGKGDALRAAAVQLNDMSKSGVLAGLELNALRRCRSPEEQMRLDHARDLDRRAVDPFLMVGIGTRMMVADECAKLLGIPSMVKEHVLPQRIVDIANREKHAAKDQTKPLGDAILIHRLQQHADAFKVSGGKTFHKLLEAVAAACGM